MKKALILAFDFPPHTSIGAQRPFGWCNYLALYGIHPTVVTRQWEPIQQAVDYIKPVGQKLQITHHEQYTQYSVPFTPNFRDRWLLKYGYSRLRWPRKLASLWIQLTQFLTNSWDTTAPIYEQALQLLQNEQFDIIIATGEPFVLFKHAAKLSQKTGIPWVADYRDCWTNNMQIMRAKGPQKWLHTLYFRWFEKCIVQSAACITTAAPSYQESLSQLFKNQNIEVIFNGSDPGQLPELTHAQHPIFTLSYAGIFYPHQAVELFLEGVTQFKTSNPEAQFQLIFYGLQYYPEMCARVTKAAGSLLSHITFTPRLPYPELMQALAQSHVQILLSAAGANWLNAKIFDYLEAGRPIVLCENDRGILAQIIHEMNAGKACNTAAEVSEYIHSQYLSWQKQPQQNRAVHTPNRYTRKEQAGILANVLYRHMIPH